MGRDTDRTRTQTRTPVKGARHMVALAGMAAVLLLLATDLVVVAADSPTTESAAAAATAAIADTHRDSVKAIFAWVDAAKDGFVTPKQSVRRMVDGNQNTPLIVYATQDIEKGELLVQTPWTHVLVGDSDVRVQGDEEWHCGVTQKLAREMRLGADSFYAPYSMYLMDEPENQLPCQYSPAGRDLLNTVIGKHPDELRRSLAFEKDDAFDQRLMPERLDYDMDVHWIGHCNIDPSDKITLQAAAMVTARADDDHLIPAYDAFNHRNNDLHNDVEYMNAGTTTEFGKHSKTHALRTIKAGEQIFLSYNMCQQCGGRKWGGFGTPEMYREYGFVEWYPRRWHFPGLGDFDEEENPNEMNQFDLFQNEDSGDLTVVWTHLTANQDRLDRFRLYLEKEIRRLKRLKNIEWADIRGWTEGQWKESGISQFEWSNINQFVDAYIVAMTLALRDLNRTPKAMSLADRPPPLSVSPEGLDGGSHYDSLEEPELDDLAYYKHTCDTEQYFNFNGYLDTEVAFYSDRDQLLGYFESYFFNKQLDEIDVCYDIDNTVQACSKQRPYHTEVMTHAAARYIQNVKRVAIVGNGDSMLLHEVMKYPDIEYVLNLELDQMVTRKAFKHFGTEPYFDDQRVDWWFGDVAKSLLVLPADFGGSFDLVLIDLAEYVLTRNVTNGGEGEGMDVFSALSLLVNRDHGILVKNELNFQKVANTFDYSMELTFESPSVCSEMVSFGSDGVDFVRAPIYDHGVKDMGNLVYTSTPGAEDAVDADVNVNVNGDSNATWQSRHNAMHDFRTHPRKIMGHNSCSTEEEEKDEVEVSTTSASASAHGVLDLMTLEHVLSPLDSFRIIAKTMKAFIEGIEAFTILEDGVHYEEDPFLCLIVMEEGYVVARIQEREEEEEGEDEDEIENNFYVGFDIHLWSKTHLIEALKKSFYNSYGSKHVSSHKIVVGGMIGSDTQQQQWKEDAKHVGPRTMSPKACNEASSNVGSSSSSSSFNADSVGGIAIEEVVALTLSEDVVAAVFCGRKGGDSCTSLDVLNDHELVKEVIPIYDCSTAVEGSIVAQFACERMIIDELTAKVNSANHKLNMFVLDSDTSQQLHQIANSIFDSHKNRESFLASHSIAVTWSSNDVASSNEPWRWEFLDRYRKQIHHDPVKLAEFVIHSRGDNKKHKAYQLGVVSTNDPGMNPRFDSFEKRVQTRLPEDATIELRNLHGGLYNWVEEIDHTPKKFYQKDYDSTLAEEHFEDQLPLARQVIFQYDASKVNVLEGPGMSMDLVEQLIFGAAISNGNSLEDIDPTEFEASNRRRYPVGKGCVFLMVGETFNIVSVWDGRDRLDINFFGFFDVSPSSELLSWASVVTQFDERLTELASLTTLAIDSQPRGLERVVNLPEDLASTDREDLARGRLAQTKVSHGSSRSHDGGEL